MAKADQLTYTQQLLLRAMTERAECLYMFGGWYRGTKTNSFYHMGTVNSLLRRGFFVRRVEQQRIVYDLF